MRAAPLNTSFMLISMIGFLFSALYLPSYSVDWAFAIGTLCSMMFVASLISMIHGPPEDTLIKTPRIHGGKL